MAVQWWGLGGIVNKKELWGGGVALSIRKGWLGGVVGEGEGWDPRYLWTVRCRPLRGGRGGCNSSWASREKWSEGMWGCGQPVMQLSIIHWVSSGPSKPSTLMWVLVKKM